MKKIALLGSTGSIGRNVLNVARHQAPEFRVVALAAKGGNLELLEEQAIEFKPDLIAVYDEEKAKILQKKLPHIPILTGEEGLVAVAVHEEAEMLVSAMSGTIGLKPTIAAIQAKKQIALANKEVLVSGGELVMRLVRENKVFLVPIDSEHSAIFQCLNGEKKAAVNRIILTASGGPFRLFKESQLKEITVDQALNHPTWKMGKKVTIDSSTLMNKGLEVIEAYWLFGVELEKIEVVIHPQSIIHSMVEFQDGSIMAQMGRPDMSVPIQYAMTYPERKKTALPYFDFTKAFELEFSPPNLNQFCCLRLAFEALKKGGSFACYMNAANEVLVERFLNGEIAWIKIGEILDRLMAEHVLQRVDSLEAILAVDKLARMQATAFCIHSKTN